MKQVSCEACKANSRFYSDGLIGKDWKHFMGPVHPKLATPDVNLWTYQVCAKNKKELKFLNLTGECKGYEANKVW